MPGWAVGMLASAAVAAAIIVRRRRSSIFVLPDTVPDDFVERERERV
jgi:hypothetical protein